MSMFRNVKERGVGLFSGHAVEGGRQRGMRPLNRRARVLNLEWLENRQLLSVSPGISPDDTCDLGQSASFANGYADSAALVSAMDPTEGAVTAWAAVDGVGDDSGTAPVLADDAYAMKSTQQLGSGVLANDMDADGDELTVTLQSDVSHGQLKLESNGLFTYRPDSQFGGVDTFTYTVSDGIHESGPATVTIEVTAAESHKPDAVDDVYTLGEDTVLTIDRGEGLLANDTDADDDALFAGLVTGPQHGTVTVGRYGSFTYTPDANYHGTDEFTYAAGDLDGQSEPATVTLTVEAANDAPVSSSDAYTTSEDGTLTIDATAGVLANDSDIDGDWLTASVVQQPSHGTVTFAEDGSFQYTPESDFQGEDSFTYVAGDGQASSEVTSVTILVEAVNDGPAAAADAYSIAEDGTLSVDAEEGVLANDTDSEGDTLTVSLVDQPSHGTVTLAEDGSFQYTPEPGFHGEDSFTYMASDGHRQSSVTMVAIAIDAMNDVPVSTGDSYSVAQDSTLTVDTATGVLANDTDSDGDPLTAALVDQPAHGSVTLAEDGSFVYTPEAGFSGEDSFTYTAGDGQAVSQPATVAITVTATAEPAPGEDIQLSIQLQVTDNPFGAEVDTLWTNSTFWVSAYVEDLRDIPAGVIGGAIDIAYDAAAVVPTGEVVFGDAFTMFQQGEVNGEDGLVDETGALTATAGVGAGQAAAFVSWQFTRAGDPQTFINGNTVFAVDAAEGTSTILPSNFALTGSGTGVEWSNVEMGEADVDLIFADFNQDQRVDHFDLALWVPHSGTSADAAATLAAGVAGYEPMFDLDSSSTIDQADLDLLASAMYTVPARSQLTAEPWLEETDPIGDTATALADLEPGSELAPAVAIDTLLANEDLWA